MTADVQTAPMGVTDCILALRPRQWIKNIVVLAAFFFALGDKNQHISIGAFFTALAAAAFFTLAAGGIYVFNDLRDRNLDRAHPVKCRRPIAAGRLKPRPAIILGVIALTAALTGGWLLAPAFALALAVYVAIQAAYTMFLKHVHLVDVFVIAVGFVLRAVAGGLAIGVQISPWLVICTFLMALFLALCKRRHEMQLMENDAGAATRPCLAANSMRLLDQLIAITAGAVVIAYAVYTQWPETTDKFQTHHLYLTIPFVVFGVFRYLDRVYLHNRGSEPESVLLTDVPLLLNVLGFALTALAITMWH